VNIQRVRGRHAFSIVELIVALAITATLLLATMMALDASFQAYRGTTRTASTGMSGRVIIERLQTMVRTGVDFGPLPANPLTETVASNTLSIDSGGGSWVTLRWDPETDSLLWEADGESWILLEGVTQIPAGEEDPVSPFTMVFKDGRWLQRAVIDLVVVPPDSQQLMLEGTGQEQIRLVGSAMPRVASWDN